MSQELDEIRSTEAVKPSLNPYIAIIILTIATFMEVLDANIVNVSLPRMAADLNSTPTETSWVIGSYLIANAMILPISGWLAIYFGRKNYYQICVVIFTASSFLCGISTNLGMLIFFRIIQGLSGSGLATSEQAMIADLFPPEKLGRAFSIYAFGLVLAPVIGPTLGGWITDALSWHWIFFINVPIGFVSYFLVSELIHESERSKQSRLELLKTNPQIDWIGIILVAIGFGAFELVLEEGNKQDWLESNFIVFTIIIAIFSLLLGITWEYYQDKPAVDISMFKNRNFAISCILLFTVRFVMFGSTFLVPYFAQILLGYNATNAGLLLLPGAVTLVIMMPIVGFLTDKFDARKIIFFGLIIFAFSLWNLTSMNLEIGFNDLAKFRMLQIFGLSFLSATMMAVGFYYVPPEKNDSASSMITLCSNLGASLGVAISTMLITRYTQFYINNLGYHTTQYNQNYTETVKNLSQALQHQGFTATQALSKAKNIVWETLVQQASMLAILDVFKIFILAIILIIPVVFFLKPKRKNNQGH
ncbi:MAG: DHA2 family efflux MFS transporter permease subunit [Pyrinomonadaceae bacterium]|nr:DHA2 family efflux MFS transporter permease subunit [Pyrinomonadaceae bacterium]